MTGIDRAFPLHDTVTIENDWIDIMKKYKLGKMYILFK